jgi:predicted RNA-binding protein with PUA-like domain
MNYWLMKTEPGSFGVDDLEAAPHRTTSWDGVRNYQARNMMRDDMQRGDKALLYHSSCPQPGVVAVLSIVREGYPDPSAFDRKNQYFDAASTRANPRWFMVDVKLERRLARVITLETLREYASSALEGMWLLRRGNRLSITPLEAAHFRFILTLE